MRDYANKDIYLGAKNRIICDLKYRILGIFAHPFRMNLLLRRHVSF